mmetsp:Transcript_5662/g.21444  ORF Transcript_5662/g.21444 Transcript_5662/m.21444 type:complete len:207 (+) Transcript_5662:1088-1708(+)
MLAQEHRRQRDFLQHVAILTLHQRQEGEEKPQAVADDVVHPQDHGRAPLPGSHERHRPQRVRPQQGLRHDGLRVRVHIGLAHHLLLREVVGAVHGTLHGQEVVVLDTAVESVQWPDVLFELFHASLPRGRCVEVDHGGDRRLGHIHLFRVQAIHPCATKGRKSAFPSGTLPVSRRHRSPDRPLPARLPALEDDGWGCRKGRAEPGC